MTSLPLHYRRFVYLISRDDGSALKIGVSKSPDGRLRQLQGASGCKLNLIDKWSLSTSAIAFAAERAVHIALDEHRLVGEWFSVAPDRAREVIEKAIRKAKVNSYVPRIIRSQSAWRS